MNSADDSNREHRLQKSLREGSPAERTRAAAEVREMLVRFAHAKLAEAARNVNTNAESLVQSALTAIDREAEIAVNDEQFLARLRLRLWHKFLDRKKRAANRQQRLDEGSAVIDPPAEEAGPSTIIDLRDRQHDADERFLEFVAVLESAAPNERVREIVEHSIIRGRSWKEIEAILGVEANTLKVALSRARATLVSAVLEPFRPTLTAEDWGVAEAILVRRLDVEEASELLGLRPQELRAALAERILPAFHDRYGAIAAERLNALTGWVR